MSGPLISVIVPVYNVEDYLAQCIGSIRRQTYANLEIILVDDGSTDGSGQLCDRFQLEDSRVRVIHKENGGLSSARNAGMDTARGRYIYFVDSDDWVSETMVEETASLMERYGYDQCVWGASVVEADGKDSHMGRREPLTLRFSTPKQKRRVLCRWLLTYRLGWTAWSRVYRREIIEGHGLRFQNEREIGAEDLDFNFRYLACCQNLYYIPRSFYYYRQRSGSIMDVSTLQDRGVRMLHMIRREEEMLSGRPMFRPFYIYGGVIIVSFTANFFKGQSTRQGLARILACFQGSKDWGWLQEQARRTLKDRVGVCRACGLRLGGQVCSLCRYIVYQNPGPFCWWNWIQRIYENVRDIKSRLRIDVRRRGRGPD